MTQEKVAFIGRENELKRIDTLVDAAGQRRVLFVQGEGGVGKTRLLQEIRDRCLARQDMGLAVTEVLAFDDRNLHLPENLRYRIAEELGQDTFAPYCRHLIDLQRSVGPSLRREQLEQKRQEALHAFNACLQETLDQRRGIILLDTTDALEEGGSAWEYIATNLALQPCNMLLILAGRDTKKLYDRLSPVLKQDAHLIKLLPLSEEDSIKYLEARQNQLHCTIDPTIAKKIVFLARGRPILIDLAVDWLAHELPLSWIEEKSLEALQALPPEEMEKRREEFQHNLVRRVLNLRTPVDRLLLALTHAYPANAPLTARLLEMSEEEAAALLREAKSYISVKQLPSDWVTLHDEIRRLLEEVEKEVDPEGRRKRADNARAAEHFEARVKQLRENLQALAEQEAEKEQPQEVDRLDMQRTEIEQEYWLAASQWLHHTLRVSPGEGMEIFTQLFEEATNAYRFAVRDGFIHQVDFVRQQLTPQQQYELDIRRTKDMLDSGNYQDSKTLLLKMLDQAANLTPSQQVDMYIQLGNLEIRLGDFRSGLDNFTRAVAISREHSLKRDLMFALNALGWGQRLIGRFETAIDHYKEALELAIVLDDAKREAWILNNMAFATARLGQHQTALNLCDQALNLWREVDFVRGLGAVHEVYGEVYVLSSDFDHALDHYKAALDIFEPVNDYEWLSRVYAGCGLALRLKGDLDNAYDFLKRALDVGIEKDRTMILHRLGHIYLARDMLDEAERLYTQSYNLSREAADADLELNNLSDLAEIALRKGEYDRVKEFTESLKTYQEYWPDVRFSRAEGTLLKTLGDLALCAHPDNIDAAWSYYERAFPLLAEHGELRPYSAQVQFGKLNALLQEKQIPLDTVQELGRRLRDLWREKGLDNSHPDALYFVLRWREGEYDA
ncbi:MAG: tetratricopeptide repeat protein [Anaerolineae bacterium]|jgi:tetratricopeptide (TPR) repeat protein